MKVESILTKKKFDELMVGVNAGYVKLVQGDYGVKFDQGTNRVFVVDFVNYYNWFDKKKHGKDRVIWEKSL